MRAKTMRMVPAVAVAVCALGLVFSGVAFATEDVTESGADSERQQLLSEGRAVYEANCQSCHQPDGAGISGVFPPLVDNDRVADADYVAGVIKNGLEGEIEVAGVTYDGRMPGFAALSDDEIAAATRYVQEGFGAAEPVATTTLPPAAAVAGDEGLPAAAVLTYVLAFAIFALTVVAVLSAVILARRTEGTFTTVQVWLKASIIFGYFVVATVFIPSMVVESSFLARPPSVYEGLFSGELWGAIRDIIGASVWLLALLFGWWALRRAQQRDLI